MSDSEALVSESFSYYWTLNGPERVRQTVVDISQYVTQPVATQGDSAPASPHRNAMSGTPETPDESLSAAEQYWVELAALLDIPVDDPRAAEVRTLLREMAEQDDSPPEAAASIAELPRWLAHP